MPEVCDILSRIHNLALVFPTSISSFGIASRISLLTSAGGIFMINILRFVAGVYS